jgi:hypothetical protein
MPWIDYVTSLEELDSQPAFIILYPSGLSGEFLASALTDSIDSIAKPTVEHKETGRTVYREFFNHALKNDSRICINTDELIYRVNVARNLFKGDHYVILAHPNDMSIKFINQYLNNRPLIEITMNNLISRKFAAKAAIAKIQSGVPLEGYLSRQPVANYQHFRHLQIEWTDLILDRPGEIFDVVQHFVGLSGDRARFEQAVMAYRKRNQDLIKEAHEI